jgi:hypothetical protein
MPEPVERPEVVEEEHLEYLDTLRESGCTNMYGASVYLIEEFELSTHDSLTILAYWMKTFEERHSE